MHKSYTGFRGTSLDNLLNSFNLAKKKTEVIQLQFISTCSKKHNIRNWSTLMSEVKDWLEIEARQEDGS